MEAYIVEIESDDPWQPIHHLVFAGSQDSALRFDITGEDDAGLADVSSRRVRRYPIADGLKSEPGELTDAATLLSLGWSLTCENCQKRFSEDEDENGEDVEAQAVGPIAFCCSKCRVEYDEEIERRRSARQAALLSLTSRYPFVTDCRPFIGSPGSCQNKCFDSNRDNAAIVFRFPGSRFETHYCHGCGQVFVCRGDIEAWRRLTDAKGGECDGQ